MFVQYLIILSTSILIFSSNKTNCSRLIVIFNRLYMKNLDRRMINGSHARIRREFLMKDRENFNLYGNDDDGKFLRNQPDDLNEQKRLFDGEYYLSPKNQYRIRDLNELYDEDITRLNRDHDSHPRYMQHDEDLFNGNRLANELNDYYPLLKKDRNRFGGKKSFENDFLDKQD